MVNLENPILRVTGVSKYFGKLKALDNVSVEIPRGAVTLLIGPNGSGKTTLVNVISGALMPDSGTVEFEGRDITRLPPHERFKLGIVRSYQIPRLFPGLSVLENVLIGRDGNPGEGMVSGILKGRWEEYETRATEDALAKLKFLGLLGVAEKKTSELSGGQLKLLEMARSTMSLKPKLILLDEPTAGVVPSLAHEMLALVKKMSVELGITFLVVEHRLDIAANYADYAYALHLGSVVARGRPKEVMSDPKLVEIYIGD
ncbi:MAG: ABC transporter ATP-binding protein [Acidilobaceae archaeon]|nr:ABC transporter ATP-binding protein [Acidilobaceae archaeon]MDW7973752.1 ABC transporter ATP-binding protein [Sulfolobales archaeon]